MHVVAGAHATLANGRPAMALPVPVFHRRDHASFAWRTGSLGHFSYWVNRDKIKWRGHEEASIRRFLTTHLPSCDCIGRHQHDRSNLSAALLHLLRFLRTHGHASAHTPEADTIEAEVQRFDAYLDKICGLAPKTRRLRRDYVRRFLSAHF